MSTDSTQSNTLSKLIFNLVLNILVSYNNIVIRKIKHSNRKLQCSINFVIMHDTNFLTLFDLLLLFFFFFTFLSFPSFICYSVFVKYFLNLKEKTIKIFIII